MSISRRSSIIFILILLWLAISVALYFVAHKPANNDQLAALIGWLPTLLVNVSVWLVAAGVGYRLLHKWAQSDQRAMLSIGLGLGLYSGATGLLGLMGLLRTEIAWLLIAIGLIIGARSIRAWGRDLRGAIGDLRPTSIFARLAMGYCVVMLVISFLQALAPPTAWDGLAYHLKGPDIYLAAGRITHSIDLPYLGFPQFGEMLFLYTRLLGAQYSSLMHWIFAVLTVLLIAGEARRTWNEGVGWIAGAIFLSAETVVLEAGWPYVDLMLAFCALAAYVCVRQWQNDRLRASLILTGIFTGFAVATKYSAAPMAVGLMLVVAIRSFRTGPARSVSVLRTSLKPISVFGLAVVLAAAPWYLKNVVSFGNPFYPFVFGGPYWDAIRAQSFGQLGTGFLFTEPWRLITAPWDATIWGVEGKLGYSATIGPLFLMLTPVTLLGWRSFERSIRGALNDAFIVIGVTYAGWLIGLATSDMLVQSRLLMPALPLLAIVGAGAFGVLGRFDRASLSLRRLGVVLVSIVLIATAIKVSLDFAGSNTLAFLSGSQSRDQFLTDRLGLYYVVMQSLRTDAPDGPILFLWEPRSLYCEVDCRSDVMIDHWWHARRAIGSPDQIAVQWQRAGIKYVLVSPVARHTAIEQGIDQSSVDDQQAFDQFVADHLQLVRDYGGAYQLYRWR
jgi:hypothetical protein